MEDEKKKSSDPPFPKERGEIKLKYIFRLQVKSIELKQSIIYVYITRSKVVGESKTKRNDTQRGEGKKRKRMIHTEGTAKPLHETLKTNP